MKPEYEKGTGGKEEKGTVMKFGISKGKKIDKVLVKYDGVQKLCAIDVCAAFVAWTFKGYDVCDTHASEGAQASLDNFDLKGALKQLRTEDAEKTKRYDELFDEGKSIKQAVEIVEGTQGMNFQPGSVTKFVPDAQEIERLRARVVELEDTLGRAVRILSEREEWENRCAEFIRKYGDMMVPRRS